MNLKKCLKTEGGKKENKLAAIIGAAGAIVAGLTGALTAFITDDDDGNQEGQNSGTRWEATLAGYYDRESSDRILKLADDWSFKVGDDLQYAEREFDHSGWEQIEAGEAWEDEGHPGYDGFAWYRQRFAWRGAENGRAIHLRLGRIDDADEVFINGVKIGATGGMPPKLDSAWDTHRVYRVPQELLRRDSYNVVAVRVYDLKGIGGLVNTGLAFYALNLPAPVLDLKGEWEISHIDDANFPVGIAEAGGFASIIVPGYWDRQGMGDFNGYAWYRKAFALEPRAENLIMMLGKIDDSDEVYLNGKLIGKTGGDEAETADWQKRRAYEFSGELLRKAGNVLAVRVYDDRLGGGIYTGPIGIMTVSDHAAYWQGRRGSRSKGEGWTGLWNWLLGRD